MIETPSWLIGSLLAGAWPLVALVGAYAAGQLTFRIAEARFRHSVAVALAIVVGLYAAMVLYETEKWLGASLLHQYEHRDED